MYIYFKIEISIEDLSDLTYQMPQEVVLFIRVSPDMDQYFGVVRDDYYSEIIAKAPRRSVDSLDTVSKEEVMRFYAGIANDPTERFIGNRRLLS
jgi:hypothetical protein